MVGVSPVYFGVSPYATLPDCSSVPSSSTNLIVYSPTVLEYLAVYVASPVTLVISGVQPAKAYVYWASAFLVGVSPVYFGVSPYATLPDCSSVPSSSTNLIVYSLTVEAYVAVYVASPVTLAISGVQPANVYVYCASAFLEGVSPLYVGVSPYQSLPDWSSVPSSSTNLIVYSLTVVEYVAVYVVSPVTGTISGVHPANVYVCWASGFLVGVSPVYFGVSP